MLETLLR